MSYRLSALFCAACLYLAGAAHAQNYPTRTITIVVTAAAGGVTDVVARAMPIRSRRLAASSVSIARLISRPRVR